LRRFNKSHGKNYKLPLYSAKSDRTKSPDADRTYRLSHVTQWRSASELDINTSNCTLAPPYGTTRDSVVIYRRAHWPQYTAWCDLTLSCR